MPVQIQKITTFHLSLLFSWRTRQLDPTITSMQYRYIVASKINLDKSWQINLDKAFLFKVAVFSQYFESFLFTFVKSSFFLLMNQFFLFINPLFPPFFSFLTSYLTNSFYFYFFYIVVQTSGNVISDYTMSCSLYEVIFLWPMPIFIYL